ncbi:enoyl-CoA hydratase/isomerase family protein [Sphingosinicella terrae]|uniref:enoyl-CoA hydratase/isomerase family protein n=1 Tax=Sphingosinicella terrae TaxID=2172047 RepID=UPI000E0D3646|nr:enoyl-CoA hydratase-related protein [Sphingosinicella terrae]
MGGSGQDGRITLTVDQGVARIRFDRPKAKNALTFVMCRSLVGIIAAIAADDSIGAVLIDGAGGDFCAGADLGDLGSLLEGSPDARAEAVAGSVVELTHGIFAALAALPIPVVAAVRGWAVGAGFQFALGADLLFVSETARFRAPQIALGHVPDHGESWFLPRKVGWARAAQVLLLGETLDAAQAERWGLASRMVPDASLDSSALAAARQLADGPRLAIRETKALLQAESDSLSAQYEAELAAVRRCAASEDFTEALTALRDRRPPRFGARGVGDGIQERRQ